MKRKIAWLLVILLMPGVLAASISLADTVVYSDTVAYLIKTRNPDVTRDELTAMYGDPYVETDNILSFWFKEEATYVQFCYEEGRLAYIVVTYGTYKAEYWDRTYTMFDTTRNKITEILGKDWGKYYYYNDTGTNIPDLNCAIGAWSCEGFGVTLIYNRSDDDLTVKAKLSFTP